MEKEKNRFLLVKLSKGLKYFIFATNIVAMVLLLLSTYAPTVSPSSVVFIAYLGLGFPFLVIVNVIYLLLWIVSFCWKYVIAQIVVLAFCWNAISVYLPMHDKTEVVPDNCIKVMSYNVRGFDWLTGDTARRNPILEYIATSNADVICMQEFAVDEKKKKNNIISLKEFDDIMVDYPYRTIIRLGHFDNTTIYGLACYSKFPIHKVARIPIESEFNGSAMYEIRVNKKKITIVNNHLESNRITAEDKALFKELVLTRNGEKIDDMARTIQLRMAPAFLAREVQADIISAHIKKQRENTNAMIVCGDFNDTPLSYAYQTIKGNFVDSFRTTGNGLGITYHENGILLRIDYIMHTQNIKSYNCEVGKVKYSDHYPIWSYLSLDDI